MIAHVKTVLTLIAVFVAIVAVFHYPELLFGIIAIVWVTLLYRVVYEAFVE